MSRALLITDRNTAAARTVLVAFLLASLTGCSWLGIKDSRDDYLDAKSIPRVVVPEGLDTPVFSDALRIPAVDDSRGITGERLEIGLPEALSTAFGVEQIVIRKLGDERWVFIDTPPAAVWPKIRLFWEVNNMEVQSADPRRGILETSWLSAIEGDADRVYSSLKSGVAWSNNNATVQHKFRLRIEAGIRSGSSEVHLEHKQVTLGAPVRVDTANWNGTSDDAELENKVLTELAFFLGETIPQGYSVSQGAMNIRSSRVEILPDLSNPILRYKLDFDRTWATVGEALEDAGISVEDLDRTSANYFVYYDDSNYKEPGFFSKLFMDEKQAGEEKKYLVHIEDAEDGVRVTILKTADIPANPLIAERLLKIIKEYSS
ncbi:MAG: outer membrane protein assembly factor BamC [Candidatus Pseudothioglobus sp.]|jgi:outer membrane protein assembly factor BamC